MDTDTDMVQEGDMREDVGTDISVAGILGVWGMAIWYGCLVGS
jgi:hypothetical protein